MYYVYILYSQKIDKYYAGLTIDVQNRLAQHNAGISAYTLKGILWELVYYFDVLSIQEAKLLEKSIKGLGIKRFLEDKGIARI
jgi:putative endonuclease